MLWSDAQALGAELLELIRSEFEMHVLIAQMSAISGLVHRGM